MPHQKPDAAQVTSPARRPLGEAELAAPQPFPRVGCYRRMSRREPNGAPPLRKIPLEVFAGSEAWANLPLSIKVAVVHVWRAERTLAAERTPDYPAARVT